MGHNLEMTAALLLALAVGACGGDAGADDASQPDISAMAVRDSIRSARAAAGAPTVTQSSGATAEPPTETAVQRETFAYVGGTRDPFASLISMKATGPSIENLLLVGVYEARSGSVDNSVAVLREKDSGKRYMLREGDRIGRMQVVAIATKDVTFRIEEFGFERQQTLSLRKQEETTP